VAHHLKESIVVLTKGMISDQLDYVGIAGDIFTIEDLKRIRARRIGRARSEERPPDFSSPPRS
jgi:hypothetical protein